MGCLTAAGCPFFPLATWSNAQTLVGWTAGAGVEWAFADNWTAKLEYLYVDLGHSSTTFPTPAVCAGNGNPMNATCVNVMASSATVHSTITDNIVRVGLNYQFH